MALYSKFSDGLERLCEQMNRLTLVWNGWIEQMLLPCDGLYVSYAKMRGSTAKRWEAFNAKKPAA
jgi:hypothetical protein